MTGTPMAYRPPRLDVGLRPTTRGNRRLPAVDAGKLTAAARYFANEADGGSSLFRK